MRYLAIFLLLLSTFQLFGQSFKERKIKSTIKTAKVFLEGAELSRVGTSNVTSGKYKVIMNKLSTSIDGNSLQVKGKGDFVILSSSYNINTTEKPTGHASADSIQKEIEKIYFKLKQKSVREDVLHQKENLISKNIELGSEQKGVTSTELMQMLNLYESQLSKIKNELLTIEKEKNELKERKETLEYEFKNAGSVKIVKSGEIIIEIESKKSQTITLEASYLIKDAGWLPKYNIRATDISKPLKLEYKADVYQNTGVEWKNVALTLSNGEPSKSGVRPQLRKWELNYPRYTMSIPEKYKSMNSNKIEGKIFDENGEPLPGVTVKFENSSVGTITNFEGYFSVTRPNNSSYVVISYIGYETERVNIDSKNYVQLIMEPNLEQLEEVVVLGYSTTSKANRKNNSSNSKEQKTAVKMTSEMEENTTTIDFVIDKKYTLKSGTGTITVNMKDYDIPVSYQYFAIPKLDQSAFLVAKIPSWDQYNLLSGEANLFLEGGFVGTTIVEANSVGDTLDISLGRDKSIVITREKVNQLAKKKTIGAKKSEDRAFDIEIRNKKSAEIEIEFYDQIPVSVNSEIEVIVGGLSGGKLDNEDGFIKWEEVIKPRKNLKKSFKYTVKYPKKEKVILE